MFGIFSKKDEEIERLQKLVEKLTEQLIKVDKERCKALGIDYDDL